MTDGETDARRARGSNYNTGTSGGSQVREAVDPPRDEGGGVGS
jgi:hypothetical protein